MKFALAFLCLVTALLLHSCAENSNSPSSNTSIQTPIEGTWKLLTGTLIEKGDTVVTDYTKGRSFIKIINPTHFAFLHHDLSKGEDSATVFGAGGGAYTLKDSSYTEHLEYCNDRAWEGHDFAFTVRIYNDTLVQYGREKIDSAGIDRMNEEKYVRLK